MAGVFGLPKKVWTEQRIFSKEFSTFLEAHGCEVIQTSVNAHQQNGIVKRLHRELNEALPILSEAQKKKNWI